MLSGEATHTNFIVFDLTWSRLEHTIYHTRGEHANYYNSDAVCYLWKIVLSFSFDFSFCLFGGDFFSIHVVWWDNDDSHKWSWTCKERTSLPPNTTLTTVTLIYYLLNGFNIDMTFVVVLSVSLNDFYLETTTSISRQQRYEIVKINNWFLPDWKSKSCSL